MRRRRRAADRAAPSAPALILAILMATALVTACGSRLPESDFTDRNDRNDRSTAAPGPPLKVGIISSATSPVGGSAFTGPRDGARAYFARLNASGGLAGRPVQAVTC
ncbi:amino acid ABC transporter substrate-binding protein, partial [Streptomyces sp. NPDC057654]